MCVYVCACVSVCSARSGIRALACFTIPNVCMGLWVCVCVSVDVQESAEFLLLYYRRR